MEDPTNRSVLGLVLLAVVVSAQPASATPAVLLQFAPIVAESLTAHAASLSTQKAASGPRRPALLAPLYVSFAALQVADARSSYRAVRQGLTEVNPIMASAMGSPARVSMLKVAATGCTIAAAELLWRHHPKGAVVAMLVFNATYGAIVANNVRQLR